MAVRIKKPSRDEIIFGNGLIAQIINRRIKNVEEEEFILDFTNLPGTHKLPVRKDGLIQLTLQKKWLYHLSADPAYHRYLYLKTPLDQPTVFDTYKKNLREKIKVLTDVLNSLQFENMHLKSRHEELWKESDFYLQKVILKNKLFIPTQEEPPVPEEQEDEE